MTATCIINVRRGSVHFTRETYDRFFGPLESLILLRDGADLVILPVRHQAGGGYVIKLRNAAGDRTVTAPDFFRDNGVDDAIELSLPAVWSDQRAALVAVAAFE